MPATETTMPARSLNYGDRFRFPSSTVVHVMASLFVEWDDVDVYVTREDGSHGARVSTVARVVIIERV